ncbi:D-sedoheptulose 7-phosphate isomerase [Lichenicola sp.]|uniref:D-sedoheptulose 7-phosphate isomerase n=1 Tax=Lichenicola sp. TaxID=2804529 RepID=UPI003AFFA640
MFLADPIEPSADTAFVADFLQQSADAMLAFQRDGQHLNDMTDIAGAIVQSLEGGGKLLIAGNGGSAADAQHISGEFTSRLMYDRRPLAALALTTDTSSLTAISNDYGYDHVFSRQIAAIGRPGDVFLGITTSGRSPNIHRALEEARRGHLVTAVLCGRDGTTAAADHVLRAPSAWTPIIQQIHITAAHIICALVERRLCPPAVP